MKAGASQVSPGAWWAATRMIASAAAMICSKMVTTLSMRGVAMAASRAGLRLTPS
jgi:hypothetical protein